MNNTGDLDFSLHAWLAEPDQKRAQLRFNAYFRSAYPAICRYLRSLGLSNAANAEDIAQQALVKLFNHLGTVRRIAAAAVRDATSSLEPVSLGAFHVRQVKTWVLHLRHFQDETIGFRIDNSSQIDVHPWKERRNAINGKIAPLCHQATHFLGEVSAHIKPELQRVAGTAIQSRAGAGAIDDADPGEVDSASLPAETAQIVASFIHWAHGREPKDVDARVGLPGALDFATRASCVHSNLPRLAIPSNGLLYTIARRLFIDFVRVKRREEPISDISDGDHEGLLDELDFPSGEDHEPREWLVAGASEEESSEEADAELEARYNAFLEFLRAPLTRAEGVLASASGRATNERAKVGSLQDKFERLLAILAALRETPQPTEEEIAKRLGLTRNQVKYAIERIRGEFTHFFQDLAGGAQGRRKSAGSEV